MLAQFFPGGKGSACQCRRHRFNPLGVEDPFEKEMATHSNILAWEIPLTEEPGELQSMGSKRLGYDLGVDFPGSSAGKECACNAEDPGSIPGSERSAGDGIGYPFQYSWTSLVAQLVKDSPAVWEN